MSRSFFFLLSFLELGCDDNHTVVLNSISILRFLRLEVAFYRKESSLYKAVEVRGVLVFALCLYIHEKRATLAVDNRKCVCFVQNKKWRKVQIIK